MQVIRGKIKMSKYIKPLLVAALVGCVFVHCSCVSSRGHTHPLDPVNGNNAVSPPAPDQETVSAQNYTSYPPATANNYFGLDFYSELKSSEAGNIFFSPFSIFSAMSMTAEGARNSTWNEMRAVLHLQADDNERWNAFLSLINTINDPIKQYQLKTANNLWLENTMTFLPEYLDTTQNYYLAELTNMDFIGDPEGSRVTINDRVEQQTEEKIKNLLPAGSIDSSVKLVLTNAIYFKAEWLSKFLGEDTYERDFYVSPGETIKVDMMRQGMMGVIEDYHGVARVLELPYLGNEVSMFIFLPDPGEMAELENNMTIEQVDSWMASRTSTPQHIHVSLPKFKVETEYTLNDILSDMGMPLLFNPGLADLSGMIGYMGLYVSLVVHKAFVAVDEEGTEAAAATGVVCRFTSAPMYDDYFMANHPFIFTICENSTDAILFMGRINYPSK